MQGGGYENYQQSQQDQYNQSNNNNSTRSSGGLIPVTAKIINSALINKEEGVEYKGILLSDICIVGYIKEYKEYEARVNIQIWDHTGLIHAQFYNKNEAESNAGLTNFNYKGERQPVKIFGTIRVYKKEKNIQGARIVAAQDNDLFYHFLEVMNDWIFLTGKMTHLNEMNFDMANESAKNIARVGAQQSGNSSNNVNSIIKNKPQQQQNNQSMNIYDIAQATIDEYRKRRGTAMLKSELGNMLQKKMRSDDVTTCITFLLNNGFIAEDDETHYVIN